MKKSKQQSMQYMTVIFPMIPFFFQTVLIVKLSSVYSSERIIYVWENQSESLIDGTDR